MWQTSGAGGPDYIVVEPLQQGIRYYLRMADGIYAISDFPDDDFLWRVEWIGGVAYNTSAPSNPLIDICLAQFPVGETNPLSLQSRASQIKKTVKGRIGSRYRCRHRLVCL